MRSASRKVQFPELRPQGVLSIDSSSEDDAGGDGVKDTSGLARARAPGLGVMAVDWLRL